MTMPYRVPKDTIAKEERERIMESMSEMICDYVSGDHFENRLHKLTCDKLGIDGKYDPEQSDESVIAETIVKEAYYNQYANIQMQLLALAMGKL